MKKMSSILVMLLLAGIVFAQAAEMAGDPTTVAANTDTTDGQNTDVTNADPGDTDSSDDIDPEYVDPETEDELGAFGEQHGALMRVLQLEKAIRRNLLRAEIVISYLSDMGEDTSELESIKAELEEVLKEVQELDLNSENKVQEFVDLKKEAITLTKQFRNKVHEILSTEGMNRLRERIQNYGESELEELQNRIRNARREYNAQIVGNTLEALGIEDDELVNNVKNGEVAPGEIRAKIAVDFKNLDVEAKKTAYQTLKEANIKKAVAIKATIENVKKNVKTRQATRLQNRLERVQANTDSVATANIQKRLTAVNAKSIAAVRANRQNAAGNAGSNSNSGGNSNAANTGNTDSAGNSNANNIGNSNAGGGQ